MGYKGGGKDRRPGEELRGNQAGQAQVRPPWRCTRCAALHQTPPMCVWHPSGSSRAKTLWKTRDAKERGDEYLPPGQRAEAWKAGRGLARIVVAFTCRSQHSLWLKRSESGSVGRRWLLHAAEVEWIVLLSLFAAPSVAALSADVRGAVCELHFIAFDV